MTEREKNKYKLIKILGGGIKREEYEKYHCEKCKNFCGSSPSCDVRVSDPDVIHINIKDYCFPGLICLKFEKK